MSIFLKSIIYASVNQIVISKLTNYVMNISENNEFTDTKNKYQIYKNGITSLLFGIFKFLRLKYFAIFICKSFIYLFNIFNRYNFII